MPGRIHAAAYDAGRPLTGVSPLIRKLYNKQDVTAEFNALVARYTADCMDLPALLDLSLLLHTTGQVEKGLELQAAALSLRRVYKRVHGDGTGLRVLCFMSAGDMTANTPVDFLLEGSNSVLYFVYIDAADTSLPPLPEADVAFMAIGEQPATRGALEAAGRLLADFDGAPVLNARTDLIAAMTRDGVHRALADAPGVLSPPQTRVPRAALDSFAATGDASSRPVGECDSYLIRPVGTHAGEHLAKIDDRAALRTYLDQNDSATFYVSPFIDSRKADGLYRKQRIMFVEGRPFASHMAISDHWMVHYLTAEMDARPERRAEEAAWMLGFDTFAARHERAFAALRRAFPLDYFGIDCIEAPDGRLLVFEVDNIMIVHDMDPADLFPYKIPTMRKLFAAFQDMLSRAARRVARARAEVA